DFINQCRAEEEAILVSVNGKATAIDHDIGTVGFSNVHIARDLLAVGCRNEWSQVWLTVFISCAVAYSQRGDSFFDLLDEFISDRVNGQDHRYGHAALTSSAVACINGLVGNKVQVGIGKHQHVVLRTAEGLHALSILRGGFIDVLGNRSGTNG